MITEKSPSQTPVPSSLPIEECLAPSLCLDSETPAIEMCQDVFAAFSCADRHAERGQYRTRLKHIARCQEAIDSESGQACADRENVHVLQEDETEQECPECRGNTPPETP